MTLSRIAFAAAAAGAFVLSSSPVRAVTGDPSPRPGYVTKEANHAGPRPITRSDSTKTKRSKTTGSIGSQAGKPRVTKSAALSPTGQETREATTTASITDLGTVTDRTGNDADFRIGTASSPCVIKQAMTDAEIKSCRSR